ncbi:MAG: hypothetical protein KC518_02500 [Candidatus Cloacimonetes bacterium]|nr:hypothetical protein [Candidatus Cloacimonadota bacterium]
MKLLLLLLICQVLGATPRFLQPPASDSRWHLPGDSLDYLQLALNGNWSWHDPADGSSGSCTVPSCFPEPTEELVFSRDFILPDPGANRESSLWFGAMNHTCRVFLNGEFLGSHANGSTSFELPIPESLLKPLDSNRLEIQVERGLSSKISLPLKVQSWDPYNYGGIYREVVLLQRPRVRIEDLNWNLVSGNRPGLELNALLRSLELVKIGQDSLAGPLPLELQARLLDQDGTEMGRVTVQTRLNRQENRAVPLSLGAAGIENWSPESPRLYTLEVSLFQGTELLHRVRRTTGFRELQVQGSRLLLNGADLEVRGIRYLSQHPVSGSAMSVRQYSQDMETIKNLGANLVLLAAGAGHPGLIELCNRIGLLVIEELPACQVPPPLLAQDGFLPLARSYLQEIILRDRNQPCLLAVSLGSGLDLGDSRGLDFVTGLQDLRALDHSLLFTGSVLGLEGAQASGLDLLLVEDREPELPADPGLPMILAGIGLPVEPENQEGYANPWSSLRQARHIQQRLLELRERSDIDGALIDSYADWRGGRPLLWVPPGSDAYNCPRGIVTADRVTRAAFNEVRSLFGNGTGTTLTRGEFQPDRPLEYPMAGFLLLILLLVGLKQNKVFAQNLKRSFVHSHGFFSDVQDNRVYQLGQSFFIGLLICGASGVLFSSLLYDMRKSLLVDHLLGQILVFNELKEWVSALAWQPVVSMLTLAAVTLALGLAATVGLRILGLLFNARFSFGQALTFMAFACAPLLFCIVLGSLLFRLLQIPSLLLPTLITALLLPTWSILRLVKSLRIAFGSSFLWAALLIAVVLSVLLALVFAYYENSHSLLEYWNYYSRAYRGGV